MFGVVCQGCRLIDARRDSVSDIAVVRLRARRRFGTIGQKLLLGEPSAHSPMG